MIYSKEVLINLVSVLVGALITIIPNAIDKCIDSKNRLKEDNRNLKLNNYIELINLITLFFKNKSDKTYKELVAKVNIVNMIGSSEVVLALNNYMKTWGYTDNQENQNKKYTKLIIEIRKDLAIEYGDVANFPEIGLIDIKIIEE